MVKMIGSLQRVVTHNKLQVEFVVAFLGATYARCVAAPLNSAYKADEFEFYMDDAKSKVLIVPPEGNAAAQQAAAKLRVPVLTLRITWSKGAYWQPMLCSYPTSMAPTTQAHMRSCCNLLPEPVPPPFDPGHLWQPRPAPLTSLCFCTPVAPPADPR